MQPGERALTVRRTRRAHAPRREGGVDVRHDLPRTGDLDASHVSAIVVRRALPAALRHVAARLPEPGFCRMVPLGDEFNARLLVGTAFPEPVGEALARDIERLNDVVQRVCPGRGHAQLFVTGGDDCSKFHTDFYRFRLLVTYSGPGTEVARENALDRSALATGSDDVALANARIVRDARSVVRARAGDVVLLKGERFGNGLAAVHRSPPIAALRRSRLVLKFTVE